MPRLPSLLFLCAVFALVLPLPALAGPLETAIAERMGAPLGAEVTEEESADIAALAAFYGARDYQPLWVSETGVTARGVTLAEHLLDAGSEGLDPNDYAAREIDALLDADTPGALADLETELNLGLMQFASDLASGRVEPALFDPETFVYPQDVERGQVLTGAAGSADIDAFIESFKPSSDRYDRTRLALEDYRRLAAGGGWPNVPEGETLKPSTTDPRVQALRSRLAVTGEVSGPAAGDPTFFDADLESAVRAFQARHGLEVDGKVGRESLAALNVPVERRIDQLILNLERRRWMPDDFGDRFVFVNLADFHLKVVVASGGEEDTIFDSRVVVGTPYFRTPVFSDEITYIEINPYWTVPPSIARNELLPKIKKDPGYLAKNEYLLFDGWGESAKTLDPQNIDWTRVRADNFGYKIRQEPGDRNALGRIKFMFPNQFNVYLHDTPSKSLFGRASRAFSHGCVRVHEPITFAEFVLNGHEGWDEAKVREVIDSGKRTVVPLQTPLPVHLTYLTAWVNKDGSVHFREDIYGRDALLAKVLLADR